MALLKLAGLAAVLVITGCAVVSGVRADVLAGYCGVEPHETWARIEAPAQADAYRAIALREAGRRPRGDEYWFGDADGGVRYCITPLQRGSSVPERNGSNCDDRIGVWWDFRQTDAGPHTNGMIERICLT